MGKQINFYMSDTIQDKFVEYLLNQDFLILNVKGEIVVQPNSKSVFSMYLYKKVYGDIVMRQSITECIDTIKSPVIEFDKTIIKDDKKKVLRGRIWMSERYAENSGEVIKKSENFIGDYQMLTRWIKRYVPYQEIKKGEYYIKEYASDEMIELQEEGYALTR